jgi:hypothetical protein
MRFKLAMMVIGVLLPVFAFAQDLQFGVGGRTSLLSYNETEIDNSRLFWGGHARLRVLKYLAGEVSLQRREDNFRVNDGFIKLETVPLQLSGIVYPLAMLPVSPYFVAGTGWYYLTATITGDLGVPYVFGVGSVELTETAPHIGVGAEVFVGDHFSIGGDVRKIFLEFNTSLINYKFDAYFVNVAATFYF